MVGGVFLEYQHNFAVAVVIYNVHCSESETCQSLEKIQDSTLKVLIFDNSTRDFGNRGFCEHRNWVYLGGNGNVGISKAYNAVVDYLAPHNTDCILCLFDDDTQIDKRYFELLEKSLQTSDCKIHVPFVYSQNVIISPSKRKQGYRTSLFQSENEALEFDGKQMTAINSGMALDIRLFQNYRYDENIFLDGVDHSFIADMHKRGEEIQPFPYRCDHLFSGNTKQTKTAALSRFSIFVKDFRYILREDKVAFAYLVGKRMLRLTLQYRTWDFWKILKNNTAMGEEKTI